MYRYLYGPVPSRRLGISLGIDLIPMKTCNYNCVYCECGRGPVLTIERKEYFPPYDVLKEILNYLKENPMPDYLTFSGSGEPTLHSKIGFIIKEIKKKFPRAKIAVITNGSLLYLKDVRMDLLEADVVLPSFDAAVEGEFIKIDRPHPFITLDKVKNGLLSFSEEFHSHGKDKQIWLEVFIIEGINSDDKNVAALRDFCLRMEPDRIQLNTLDRPGAENWVKPASKEVLERIKKQINLPNVEIISRYKYREEIKSYRQDFENMILETLKRRPSTLEDISEVLGINVEECRKYLEVLVFDKKVECSIQEQENLRGIFYSIKKNSRDF